jgi:hypothetical protein
VKRWPLFFIALPAAVAVWSGWVGLGGLCGFGVIHPLPGIADAFSINTAITLPVGVESYGAYALGAWLTPGTPDRARTFARRSAIGSLVLGCAGQVIYHLLAAAHATRAPWPVVMLVACLPVVTLGFGAGLAHLLRDGESRTEDAQSDAEGGFRPPDLIANWTVNPAPAAAPAGAPDPVTLRAALNGHAAKAERMFAADVTAGRVPGIRRIMTGLKVGDVKARLVQEHLRSLIQIP